MKRILILALSICAVLNASAIDNISVTPFSVALGSKFADNAGAMQLYLDGSQLYQATSFHLFVPEAIEIEHYDEDEGEVVPVYELTTDVLYAASNYSVDFSNVNNASYAKEGYNTYFVTIYSSKQKKFKDNSFKGVLMKISCAVSSKATAGIYPIYIEDMTLTITGTSKVKVPTITSYVKVGNPSGCSLDVKGLLASTVTNKLASEPAITTIDLTNCTYIPSEGISSSATVKYSRDLGINKKGTINEWGTICLPFELEKRSDVRYYKLSNVESAEGMPNVLYFKEIDNVPAGTPAVFRRLQSSSSLNWSKKAIQKARISVPSEENGNTTKGTYETLENQTGMYFIAEDAFWKANKPITIGAFRAYFFLQSGNEASYRISVEEPDGITELEMDADGNLHEIFNLQGQRLSAPVKGQMTIVNGKKVIIK